MLKSRMRYLARLLRRTLCRHKEKIICFTISDEAVNHPRGYKMSSGVRTVYRCTHCGNIRGTILRCYSL